MENSQCEWDRVLDVASGDVRRLTSVWRYSSIPITTPENVADHSFYVALYSIMIHNELKLREKPLSFRDEGPVLLTLLLKAITHDLPEMVTGDIVRPFKYSSKQLKAAIDKEEDWMMKTRVPERVRQIIESVHLVTPNSDIHNYVNAVVKAADFLSLYQFMRREVLRGNCEISNFIAIMTTDFENMSKSASESSIYPFSYLVSFYDELAKASRILYSITRKTTKKTEVD